MSAIVMAMPRVGKSPYSSVWPPNFAGKPRNYRQVTCASASPSDWRESRRLVSVSLVLSPFFLIPNSMSSLLYPLFSVWLPRKKIFLAQSFLFEENRRRIVLVSLLFPSIRKQFFGFLSKVQRLNFSTANMDYQCGSVEWDPVNFLGKQT